MDEEEVAQLLDADRKRDLSASFDHLGHVQSPGQIVDMRADKGLPRESRREQYAALPSFMSCVGNRNAAAHVGDKALADCASEAW